MTTGTKGFTACGQYYSMETNKVSLIEQLSILANVIRQNALNAKSVD